MKKMIYPVAPGGAPMTNEIIVGLLQEQQYTAILAIIGAVARDNTGTPIPVILSGMSVTDLGGGNYSIDEGYVYMNGKIIKSAAVASTTIPAYIKEGTTTNITATAATGATFQDASDPNFLEETTTQCVTVVPVSGDYISFAAFDINAQYRRLGPLLKADTNLWKDVASYASGGYASGISGDCWFRLNGDRLEIFGYPRVQKTGSPTSVDLFTLPASFKPDMHGHFFCNTDGFADERPDGVIRVNAATGIVSYLVLEPAPTIPDPLDTNLYINGSVPIGIS